jgi:heme A synthase
MPRPKSGRPRAPVAFQVKGRPEWAEWAERLAAHSGLSVAALAELALRAEAKRQKFPEPPPARLD